MIRTRGLLVVTLFVLFAGCSPSSPAPVATPTDRVPGPSPPAASAPSPTAAEIPPRAQLPADDAKAAGDAIATEVDPALAALSRNELFTKMSNAEQMGFHLMGGNQPAEGYKSFQESAQFARELRRRFPELSPREQAPLGLVFYNDACALAMSGDPSKAFAALQEAVSAGFSDAKQLDSDTDLATVRSLPEFEAWRKEMDAYFSRMPATSASSAQSP